MGKSFRVVSGLLVVAGVVGVLALYPAAGYAGDAGSGRLHTLSLTKDYTASPWTKEIGWSKRAGGKLVFGAKNLLLGWTELFSKPAEEIQNGGNFLKGLGMGLVDGVGDEIGGALHVVTFPITCLDVTLPGGGVQLGS